MFKVEIFDLKQIRQGAAYEIYSEGFYGERIIYAGHHT